MATGSADEGDLDSLVRRVDPDRWLSSRFVIDQQKRVDLIALYAFDYELARASKVASNPLIAEIRLTWWREALDEIFGGKPVRAHPTARALGEAVRRADLSRTPLEAMIDGRIDSLVVGKRSVAGLRLAAGSAAVAAAALLGEMTIAECARAAGEVWGKAKSSNQAPGELPFDAEFRDARASARRLSAAAFPAVAHVTLAPIYGAGKEISAIGARLRLTAAVLTGSL